MPGLNRTGPLGEGPRTGRALGKCGNAKATLRSNVNRGSSVRQGNGVAGGLGAGQGGGRGRGGGRGGGRGRGRMAGM